ncbi:MAG: helix-turn-helix transcriptional regulator [Bacillota bacterium]|nr:helix-turn-helix transcriptional regulator [Bacillota bacterium]
MIKKFKTLSNNMKLLRLVNNISQDDLAYTIHLIRSTYSTYETGVKVPDLQTIDALAALYGISFDSLVNQDLSKGLLHRLYFEPGNEELADLLNRYQSLSTASKGLIMERIEAILEREDIFYREYSSVGKNRKDL